MFLGTCIGDRQTYLYMVNSNHRSFMHSIFILKIVQIYYATTPFAVFKKHKNSSYSLMRLIPERWWRRSFRNCVKVPSSVTDLKRYAHRKQLKLFLVGNIFARIKSFYSITTRYEKLCRNFKWII